METTELDEPSVLLKNPSHHKQLELCTTRAAYRQGRNLTSIKVYTVGFESQHLYIYNVPKINLRKELKSLCINYGQIKSINVVKDFETELFTECFHVHYERIQSARVAKRFLDNKSFYGGVLHVCYAPEHENLDETRSKIKQRSIDVKRRLGRLNNEIISGEAEGHDNSKNKRSYEKMIEESDPVLQHSRNDFYKITNNIESSDSNKIYNTNDRNYSTRYGNKVSAISHEGVNFKRRRFSEENIKNNDVYGPMLPEGFDTQRNKSTFGLLNNTDCDIETSEISQKTIKSEKNNIIKRIIFRK